MATDFDFQLDTLKFHLLRDAPEPSYSQRWVRQEVQTQQPIAGAQFVQSRDDLAFMHQTDWSGGSTWWLPTISATEPNAFHHSWGCDTWTRAGVVAPAAPFTIAASSPDNRLANQKSDVVRVGDVTYMLTAGGVNQGYWYTYTDGDPNAWVDTTIRAFSWSAAQDFCYNIAEVNGTVYALLIGGYLEDSTGVVRHLVTGGMHHGAGIVNWEGEVMVYNGDNIKQIIDPLGTSSQEIVYDDGKGPEFLDDVINNTFGANSKIVFGSWPHIVNTPEGIYYFKNVAGLDGVPACNVFRVERTNDGSWLGYPIAILPKGVIGLDITHHLGSIVISATDEYTDLNSQFSTQIYHITDDSLGLAGKTLGINETYGVWDNPCKFLYSNGPLLYIAGSSSVWVYDAIRGGLHMVGFTIDNGSGQGRPPASGPLETGQGWIPPCAAQVLDDQGNRLLLFPNTDGAWQHQLDYAFTPDRGELESNWFNFGLPYEDKTIYKVELETDPMDNDVVWEVYIAAEGDTAWTKAGQTGAGRNHSLTLSTPMTGTMFRYKLVYGSVTPTETWTPGFSNLDPDIKSSVRGVKFLAMSGSMIREWVLTVDGSMVMNVDNQVLHPNDVDDALQTLFAKRVMDFEDYTGSVFKDEVFSASVKLQAVQYNKENPEGHSTLTIVVREV